MEKKEYNGMELEIVRFDAEDVILTSGGVTCGVVDDWECERYTNAAGDYCEYVCLRV